MSRASRSRGGSASGRPGALAAIFSSRPSARSVAIVLATIVIALLAMVHSIAQLGFGPGSAPMFQRMLVAPTAPTQRLVVQRSGQRSPQFDAQRLLAAARQGVMLAPIDARSLSITGLALERRGQRQAALRAMRQANRLDRRDGAAQAWLVERAIRAGDVDTALMLYDAILRTRPSSADQMMPALVGVMQVDAGRAAIARYMAQPNSWRLTLIDYGLLQSPRARPVAQLLAEIPDVEDNADTRRQADLLVSRLVGERDFVSLRQIFAKLPGARASSLRTVGLDSETTSGRLGPVNWWVNAEGDVGAEFSGEQGGQVDMTAFAQPNVRGVAARKLFIMPDGPARLSWTVNDKSANPNAEAIWRIACGATGATIASSGNLFDAGTANSLTLALPKGCDAYLIELITSGGDGRDETTIAISSLVVTRS